VKREAPVSLPSQYEVYLAERRALVDAEHEQSRLFDRAILTLAAGALGLSITFIHEVARRPEPGTICWLITGWIAFVVSMLITLASFLTSQWACRSATKALDAGQLENPPTKQTNVWANITTGLNVTSALVFVTGVFLLVRFVALNLNEIGG
jgi:hypothetical protein